MYIFLDESGDLGFNFDNKNPSWYFVITILVCHNREAVLSLQASVKRTLKRKLHYKIKRSSPSELKGYSTLYSVKKYFLNALLQRKVQDWELYSIVLNKKRLLRQLKQKPNQEKLYNILSHKVLQQVNLKDCNNGVVRLIVDRCKSSKERAIFNNYLKSNLEVRLPINTNLHIMHEVSYNDPGLQAVDMFCYGIARKYTSRDTEWYNLFKHKIIFEEILEQT